MNRVMDAPQGYTVRFPKEGEEAAFYGRIAFTQKHWKVLQKMDPHHRSQVESAMKAWAARGPVKLPPQRFRFEYQFERAGKQVRLEAFKGWSVRFYGAVKEVEGKPMFLVTGYDDAKKDNDADRDLMKAAAKAAHRLIHGS
jgi:hypothetical protein